VKKIDTVSHEVNSLRLNVVRQEVNIATKEDLSPIKDDMASLKVEIIYIRDQTSIVRQEMAETATYVEKKVEALRQNTETTSFILEQNIGNTQHFFKVCHEYVSFLDTT